MAEDQHGGDRERRREDHRSSEEHQSSEEQRTAANRRSSDGRQPTDGRHASGDRQPTDDQQVRGDRSTESGLPGPLLDVLADPAAGRHRLPYLLGLLDGDDPHRRLTAGTAICLVVESQPKLCSYAVGRLVDRLDDDAPVEVAHALDYLAARRPKAVDEAVSDLDDDAERRARTRMYRTGGGFPRNEYLAPTGGDRRSGRTRIAGGPATDDPRRVYTNDGDDRDRFDGRDERAGSPQDDSAGAGEDGDGESADEDAADAGQHSAGDDETVGQTEGLAATDRSVTSGTLTLVSNRLSEVIAASRFDDLSVLTEGRRGRYGDVFRTVGTLDDEQYAVALVVYQLPDADTQSFAAGFRSAMAAWADVDHERVRAVYDWDVRPRPWAALEYTDMTLATRDDEPDDPLWTADELAGAVAHAHQRGVVHGALDPGNVGYRDTIVEESERRQPLLSNVGLASETGTAAPGNGVDPRYAAPEHFDDSHGSVDNATDVYGLGMLLYRLATGRHPYVGDADAVREHVLSGDSPNPTAVDPGLPNALDQLVGKATATEKLKRYETVTHFQRELRSIRETHDS